MELKYVGGVFGGNVKPTPFLCLVLKMLQIQPNKDIIVEFIRNEDFKYVRALGAVYMRLTGSSLDCYKYLEPLYLDYRKIKRQSTDGSFELVHMDEFIDELLRQERSCDIILPRIQKRNILEENNQLETRVSALDEDLEDMDDDDDDDDDDNDILGMYNTEEDEKEANKETEKPARIPSPKHKRSPSPHHRDKVRKRSRSREREHEKKSSKHHRDDSSRKHRSHKSKHEHKDKSRDKDRHRDRDHERHRDRGSRHDRNLSREDMEIQEANETRARLGLAPLK